MTINLLKVSVEGSLFILLMAVIRHVKFFSKKQILRLWMVCICRLLIVISLPSLFWVRVPTESWIHSIGLTEELDNRTTKTDSETDPTLDQRMQEAYSLVYQKGLQEDTQKGSVLFLLRKPTFIAIWMIGAGGFGIVLFMLYLFHGMQMKRTIQRQEKEFNNDWEKLFPLHKSPSITVIPGKGPFVYGIFSSTLVLPSEYSELKAKTRVWILRHEGMHILHKDNLRKLLFLLALCLNWYNPLVYAAFHWFQEDLELSCDEVVLETQKPADLADYATTLLTMAEKSKSPMTVRLSGYPLKNRIRKIMSYQPQTKARHRVEKYFTVLILMLLGGLMVTGCQAKKETLNFAPVYQLFEQAVHSFGVPMSEAAAFVMSDKYPFYDEEHHVFESLEVVSIDGIDFRMRIGNVTGQENTFNYLNLYTSFEGENGLESAKQWMERIGNELILKYGDPGTPRPISFAKRFSDENFPMSKNMDFWDIEQSDEMPYRILIHCISDEVYGGGREKYWVKIQMIQDGPYLSDMGGAIGY